MTCADAKQVAFVVPFLNERDNLPALYERVSKVMAGLPEKWRLILVDDGSTDGSAEWAAAKAREDNRVCLIRLSRNFGHQIAITAGLDHADSDAVIIIDADLQDPPEVAADLLAKWREGCQVVYAVRRSRAGETWAKRMLAAGFYAIFRRVAAIEVPMNAGDFRLVDRKVVEALRRVRELHRFMRGLTCWAGFKQCAVYYDRAPRQTGTTKYPVWKSAQLACDAFTSFSAAPLRWVSALGMLAFVLGLLEVASIIWNKLAYPERLQHGWASTVSIILLLGGLQLLSLGLVGQYLSRVFEEVKRRPLYLISETVGIQPRPPGD